MAKCKICKTNIPDGNEFCDNCRDKNQKKLSESYLDSLLSSVINATPAANSPNEKQYKEEMKSSKSERIDDNQLQFEEDNFDSIDISDLEDFDILDLEGDLEDQITISDEDLFGEDLTFLIDDDKSFSGETAEIQAEDLMTEFDQEEDAAGYHTENPQSSSDDRPQDEILPKQEDIYDDIPDMNRDDILAEHVINQDIHDNINPGEIEEYEEEDSYDPSINELLNALEIKDEQNIAQAPSGEYEPELQEGLEDVSEDNKEEPEHPEDQLPDSPSAVDIDEANGYEEEINPDHDDIFQLLNQINENDPVSEDAHAISEILSHTNDRDNHTNMPSDVGEVFSDALKVVSSLDDPDLDEISILESLPDLPNKKGKSGSSENTEEDKKKKKVKKGRKSKEDSSISSENDEKSKPGLIKRLFGNIHDEKSKKAARKNEKAENEEKMPSGDAAQKDKKKAAKKKDAKNKNGNTADNEKETAENNKPVKEKSNKKEKKVKKKKTKEVIEAIDDIAEDEGRINRLGASIVFLFFGLIVMVLLIGTNIFSYSLSIKNATNYFGRQKYTQAYNEVYGISIKDEDIEIYDKIMTVMFVNKQLNSYNNYYAMKKYPEALDSLLKGLSRYDKYIELATILGIDTDLNYVREQILAELNKEFHLSEKEAVNILNSKTQKEYSLNVYDVVLERMNN